MLPIFDTAPLLHCSVRVSKSSCFAKIELVLLQMLKHWLKPWSLAWQLSQNMLVSFMKRWLGSPGSITTNTAVYCLSVLSKISRRFHINRLLKTNSGLQLNMIWNIGVKHAHLHISLDCRKVKCKFNLNFLYGI